MRLSITYTLLLVCSFVLFVHAWNKEDYEIFRLRDELEAAEGKDISFYGFVGVQPGATNKEIQEAFRRKSKAIHPDKVRHQFVASKSTRQPKKSGEKRKPGVHVSKGPSQRDVDRVVKQATERYQRLGVVAKLLRSESRERYDHFLRHGFPAWRGTGYYYTRYRPGLGTVLIGLFLVGGGAAHYGALRISYNNQKKFMERYIRDARKSAWGDETGIQGIPGISGPVATPAPPPPEEPDSTANMNRRQKREMERQNKKEKQKGSPSVRGSGGRVLGSGDHVKPTEPTGARRRVTAENGKVLIVDSIGNVFLEEEDEEGDVHEFLLDLDDIHEPTFRDTAVVKLPLWAYHKALGRFLSRTRAITRPGEAVIVRSDEDDASSMDESRSSGKNTPSTNKESGMSSSQMLAKEFEIVDSTGIETDGAVGNNNAKKRGKKGKK